MDNKFLRDFMKMRQEIVKTSAPPPTTKSKASSLNTLPEPSNDITLGYIISEKPCRKEVCDYFRSRIEELVAEADD